MTLDKTWYLTCDSPGQVAASGGCWGFSDQTADGGPAARDLARGAGWKRVPNPGWKVRAYRAGRASLVDVCPACVVHYADVLAAAAAAVAR